MRSRPLIRLATLGLLLVAAPLACCQQSGSIVGVVRVLRGNFPDPVLVEVHVRGAPIESVYTDGEGRFGFNALYANVYHVVINDDHYQPVDVKVELKPDIQPIYVVQIILALRNAPSAAKSQSSTVSAEDLSAYPKDAVKEFQRGVKAEAEGKADDAIAHYRKAIKEAPGFAMAHNNLGSLYTAKSDFVPAQKEFEESIRLSPGDSKAYFNMGNLMLLAGKLDQVDRYLQEGFRRQPDSAFGFFVKGTALERTGKLPEAETALQRALELDPKMPRPHLQLVNLYLREQKSAQAMAQLRSFLRVAPNDPLAPKARDVLQKLEQGAGKDTRP
jgi:tetratricopeptide (TPR) repeat protein